MNRIEPPHLAAADELGGLIDQDIDPVVRQIMTEREDSPILRASRYQDIDAMLAQNLPRSGMGVEPVLEEIQQVMTPFVRRNTHPGFYGYVASPGLPTDPLASAMVAAYNQNVVGYPGAPGATTIERCVVRWLRQLAGFGEDADGVLMGGGSYANLTAIAVALAQRIGPGFRESGLADCSNGAAPVILCASSVHFSIQRAAAMLGIGTRNVIAVDVDHKFIMQTEELATGLRQHDNVFCVVGSAGTTTTGAVDPLEEIAGLCQEYGAWFHVDAAYGGAGLLAPELRQTFQGIELADSVTMDLHKWFYMGFDGSVLLYKNPQAARSLFFESSDYVQFPVDGPPEQHMFFHLSPELSRRFRALPVYMMFRHYGTDRLGRNVLHNVQCARYLAELVDADDDFELILQPQLSICCFRYAPPDLDPAMIDRLNRGIRDGLEAEGDFFLSPTDIHSRPVLRTCIINHATRASHMEQLVQDIRRIGRQLH